MPAIFCADSMAVTQGTGDWRLGTGKFLKLESYSMSSNNKVAIITGAGSGIGRATALALLWLTAKKVSHWYGRRFLIFA